MESAMTWAVLVSIGLGLVAALHLFVTRKKPAGRPGGFRRAGLIVLVVAAVVVAAASASSFRFAHTYGCEIKRAFEEPILDTPIELDSEGAQTFAIGNVFYAAHSQELALHVAPPLPETEGEKEADGDYPLTLKLTFSNDSGVLKEASVPPTLDWRRKPGGEKLIGFSIDIPTGAKQVSVKVLRVGEELKGRRVRMELRNVLCGLEQLAVLVSRVIGVVLGVLALFFGACVGIGRRRLRGGKG